MIRKAVRAGPAVILAVSATAALADPIADRSAIRERLVAWSEAFNAGDAAGACDLFARDVVAVVRGAPDAGKAAVCGRIEKALQDNSRKLSYAADIDEVLVSGDMAVVRLTWTLTIERNARTVTSLERGIDVFRRDDDGKWRIARFIAFTVGDDD